MTQQEHTASLQQFGYSPREATFVALAALHSGYFLARQYSRKRGKAAYTLCRKVSAFHHATSAVYGGRTHLYHLCAKPLYRALGQTDNRHRRDQDSFHLQAKVMGLDYVLLHPQYRYLPTEQEKLAYFCDERRISETALPTKLYTGSNNAQTLRHFVDKYPVRIDRDTSSVSFCYIDDGMFTAPGFETWLKQYAPLITTLGEAEIVYVATSAIAFPSAERAFAKAFPTTNGAVSPELLGYFEMRRDLERRGPAGRKQEELDAFRRLSRRYAASCFQEQYALWNGAVVSVKTGPQVRFSTFVLPFSYAFFGTAGVGK
jgi:hypothetical protein